jgi:hypothetical protein
MAGARHDDLATFHHIAEISDLQKPQLNWVYYKSFTCHPELK